MERVKPGVVAVEQLYFALQAPGDGDRDGARARGDPADGPKVQRDAGGHLRPNEVKKAATRVRARGKDQMQRAMQMELGLKELPKPPDVADALAIALCAFAGGRAWRGGEGGDEDRDGCDLWLTPEA